MSRASSGSVASGSAPPGPAPAGRIRKLSTAAVTKPLPDAPLTAEQLQVQIVPKDAAMLELIPRGDVFASHKLAPHATRADALPAHIGEKLALFEQSFSVLRFPHKVYQPVVLDPPTFNQTFNVDTVVVPQAGQSASSSSSGGTGAPGEAAAPPLSALLRTQKSKDLIAADDSVEARPTKLKQATVADVFADFAEGERSRTRGTDASAPPLPAGYEGKVGEQGEKVAPIPEGGSGASSGAPSSASSSTAGPSDDMRVVAGPPAVVNPYTAESCVTVSDGALPLRSYFPQWDWGQGAESALCERVPLPLPSSRANHSGGANAIRFLLHAKGLQLAAGGREIEPLFCELALYNVSPDARTKVSDSFYVQLNKPELIKMLEDSRTANLPKNLAVQVPGADAPASVAAPAAAAAAVPAPVVTAAASASPASATPAGASSPSVPTPSPSPIPISDAATPAAAAPAAAAAVAAPAAAAAPAAGAAAVSSGLNPDSTPISPFMPDSYVNSTSGSPCTRAIFSVPAGSRSNVVLVLLVYKVLQGKVDSVLDLYGTSAEKIKDKEIKAAEAKALEACKRWGEHRQLLLWGAQPLITETGGFRPEDCSFKELYKPPKTEEGFTVASLCDAAASLTGKTKNPKGFKVVPGSFVATASVLPSVRAQALAEAEKLAGAPVFNVNLVPARMEDVVESAESICIGHEVLTANLTRGPRALLGSTDFLSVGEEGSGGAKTARDRSASRPSLSSPSKGVSFADDSAAASAMGLSEDAEFTHVSEQAATIASDQWVEVDGNGNLVRKGSQPVSDVAASKTEASASSASSASSAGGLHVSITGPSGESRDGAMQPPMSPTSRALIHLEHGRSRSFLPPPTADQLKSGYIMEIDNFTDLSIAAAAPSQSPAAAAAAAAAMASPSSLPVPGSRMDSGATDDAGCPFHLHYTNHLYIYPQGITFSDARNVSINIQIKDTHESASEPALDVIYPRADELLAGVSSTSTNPDVARKIGGLLSQTNTSTTYHCYNAAFTDEIKIDLPLILKPSHHVLFTFHNISCKTEKVVSKGQAYTGMDDHTLLGYSMLPLYLDSRIVDESYILPVCAKLRPHYLLQKDEWDNRRNALFSVKLRVASSVYTNDPFLNRFFLKCSVPLVAPAPLKTVAVVEKKDPPAGASDEDKERFMAEQKERERAAKRALSAIQAAADEEEMLAVMLKKVIRSGQLKKKGGLSKWTDRWWSLTDTALIVYKSQKDGSKIWHHTSITPFTNTLRNAAAGKDASDDLKFAWSIRADGVPSATPGGIDSDEPSANGADEAMTPSTTAASPSDKSAAQASPASAGPASPPVAASKSAAGSAAGASGSMTSRGAAESVSSPSGVAGLGVAHSSGLDAVSFEPEMGLMADTEDEMFAWLKAIAHAKLSKSSLLDSIRSVRESQVELLIKHLPSIMRQLLNVMCAPEGLVDAAQLAADGQGASLDRLKAVCFETMLEVAFLVESGTTSGSAPPPPAAAGANSANSAAGGEKLRNVYLDTYVQYIFDDQASALPAAAAARAAVEAAAREAAAAPTAPAGVPETIAEGGAKPAPSSPPLPARPGTAGAAATPAAPAGPAPLKVSGPTARVRTYESIATLWLNLLRGGASASSSSASATSAQAPAWAQAGSAKTVSTQREYAAKYSWFMLDMLTKSLLLSTAGVRERRVSMALNFASLLGSNADGTPNSPFGTFKDATPSSASTHKRDGSSFGNVASTGPSSTFFKPATIKLLTELVCALTHEIFFLSQVSLSMSKLLNKNVALFLRDAFYIFPKAVCFDWISLYLQISHTRETVSSSLRASSSGSGSSGSSSRFKYIALQIICDHEHYVAYNNRSSAFVGEAKKYLQSNEFGEFFMNDWQNKERGWEEREEEAARKAAAAAAAIVAEEKEKADALAALEAAKAEAKAEAAKAEAAKEAAAKAAAEGKPAPAADAKSPEAATVPAAAAATPAPVVATTPAAAVTSPTPPTPTHKAAPSSMSSPAAASSSPAAAPATPRVPGIHSMPPAGHFLPFVLIKQVWLAFRQPAPAGILPAQQTLLQELALAQSAYTLRCVLLKHEYDARFQTPKRRAQVAQMYIRLLPCLWLNLDKLRTMKAEKGPTAAYLASIASPTSPPLPNGAPSNTGTICSNARKDLIACALYVLRNVPATELLRYLQQSEYRIHASNISEWYTQFVDLLSVVLETSEYAGPLMRRLESITTAGGVVANLSTILCSRMMQVQSGWGNAEDKMGISDWGGAEEIGSSRLGSLGGLLSLENKYTRTRQSTQLSGHRKSVATFGGGTMKRRDVQMSSNAQAADRARTRLAHRTLNSKAAATLMDGGDQHFHAITGIDPAIQKWEKLYAHESSAIVLHVLTQVAMPIAEQRVVEEPQLQDRLIWFLHGFLKLNQSDEMAQHMYALLASLLQQHAALIWPLSEKEKDSPRCSKWWFELLRYCSFHDPTTRAAAQSFMYDLFCSVSNATGSTTRVQVPLVRSFARVMDFLRNRRSENGASTKFDVTIREARKEGWTVLQAEPKSRDQTNDAAFIGVLSALGKSVRAIFARADQDPRKHQLSRVAVVANIRANFELLQKILETSALIHSTKANSMDPDSLMEHSMYMYGLYSQAPRVQLLYLKHVYNLHMAEANQAEAAATQFRMFQLIDAQMVALARRGDQPRIDMWSSEHALSCLRKASELFELCDLLEQAVHSECLAAAHWVVRSNPVAVVPHQKRLVTLYEKLASIATLGDTRPFGTYYRVGFYGVGFGQLDGREFVYRERDFTKLPEITSRLVALYTAIIGREITVFKDSGLVDRESLEMGQCKLQVTAVLPFFTPEEEAGNVIPLPFAVPSSGSPALAVDALRNFDDAFAPLHPRQSHFEKHTMIARFYFDTPYVPGSKKSHGSVAEQYKKRSQVFLPPGQGFPSHLKRLPVHQRVEIIMTPLQCVLEDIHKRIAKLRLEARPALGLPADIKTLTQVLSGSVNVQVNGGTAEVCQVFLHPDNVSKWDPTDIAELKLALGQFVHASGEALQVAVKLAAANDGNNAFIVVLQEGYAALVKAVQAAVPEVAVVAIV